MGFVENFIRFPTVHATIDLFGKKTPYGQIFKNVLR